MELILYVSKFLSQQLVFTYSLLNHSMKLRTAVLQQVSGVALAASTEGTHCAEIAGKCSTVYGPLIPRVLIVNSCVQEMFFYEPDYGLHFSSQKNNHCFLFGLLKKYTHLHTRFTTYKVITVVQVSVITDSRKLRSRASLCPSVVTFAPSFVENGHLLH